MFEYISASENTDATDSSSSLVDDIYNFVEEHTVETAATGLTALAVVASRGRALKTIGSKARATEKFAPGSIVGHMNYVAPTTRFSRVNTAIPSARILHVDDAIPGPRIKIQPEASIKTVDEILASAGARVDDLSRMGPDISLMARRERMGIGYFSDSHVLDGIRLGKLSHYLDQNPQPVPLGIRNMLGRVDRTLDDGYPTYESVNFLSAYKNNGGKFSSPELERRALQWLRGR